MGGKKPITIWPLQDAQQARIYLLRQCHISNGNSTDTSMVAVSSLPSSPHLWWPFPSFLLPSLFSSSLFCTLLNLPSSFIFLPPEQMHVHCVELAEALPILLPAGRWAVTGTDVVDGATRLSGLGPRVRGRLLRLRVGEERVCAYAVPGTHIVV
eukprot:3043470-Rhodomonas_salina.1